MTIIDIYLTRYKRRHGTFKTPLSLSTYVSNNQQHSPSFFLLLKAQRPDIPIVAVTQGR